MQVDDEMLIRASRDTNNLCRVCLTVDYNNRCIFRGNADEPSDTSVSELSEKLRLCGGVEVLEDDGLPTGICVECLMKVNVAYELREQCQKADMELRKLYGKALKKNNPISTRDQCCQTEQGFASDVIKLEDGIEVNTDRSSTRKSTNKIETPDVFGENNHTEDILVDNELDVDHANRSKQAGQGIVAKKEAYRTRRLTMFKRVTSMENLRNCKEMQRRYIKKYVKCDTNDGEHQTKKSKIGHGGADDAAELSDLLSEYEARYKCSLCDKCYSSKKSLDRHESTHDKEFKCDDCDRRFLGPDKLLKHKASAHHKAKAKPQPAAICGICDKSFRKTDTMVRHLNVHKRANPKEVFSILKEMRDRRKLENGRKCVSGTVEVAMREEAILDEEEKSQCAENDGSATTRELRKRAIKAEQRDSDLGNSDTSSDKFDCLDDTALFRCERCGKNYSAERSLRRHMLAHDEKRFVCNFCNMKFYRQDRLRSHMDRYGHDETKASADEPQRPPDDKSAIKLINSWIREELDSDNEGKGFPCETCGKSYDTKKSLLKHQVNAHSGRSECACANEDEGSGGGTGKVSSPEKRSAAKSKPHTCDECGKSFEKEVKLQRHLRIHERAREQQDANFKRFLCHICSKTFRQNTGLMFHMRTHTGYKPHVCKYCGRGFTSNSNCINHERTHTGDRPFVCQYCSAAFAKSCTLKAHITTHTGEANYHCKTCGKSFRRLKYLKEHRFTHTGEKPYACKICGTAYSHSGSLFVHEKKCKAQYGNYQPAVAATATQNAQQTHAYGQSPAQSGGNNCGISAAASPSSSVITPIVAALPQTHLNVINSTLNNVNKSYMDNVHPRMNSVQTAATATTTVVAPGGLHASAATADIPEMMSSTVSYVAGRYEQKANQDSTVIKISFF